MIKIVFYEFEDGTSPVKDFIRSLDVKMKAKTNKTPKNQIELCLKYKKDYERRNGND